MDTTIDQQVAMDEALVPHARRLRIGRCNFLLLSDIASKESTLQLVYDVLRLTSFFKAFLVTADVLEIYMQEFWATTTVHHHSIRNSDAYKEYYAVATGATPLKPKASVRKTRSSSDTTVTPPTTTAGPRLSTSAKGKQPGPRLSTSAKGKQPGTTSKDKSLSALSENSIDEEGDDDNDDEGDFGDDGKKGNDDDAQDDDDQEDEGNDEDDQEEEETRDEESFDPIPKTPENTDDEGNGEENLGINVGREEGQDKEDEEDELYRDVNINLGRGIQMADVHMTQEFKDSHVTLTPVNPNGQQQSSFVSS
nr:hypothetical protein [Tanacetum cinerariifolium]